MRAVSPIVAITILVVMTLAAAAFAYMTLQGYQREASSSVGRGMEDLSAKLNTKLRIERVSNGRIYVRNVGTTPMSGAIFFVDGRPLEVSGPDPCLARELCVFTIIDEVDCEGECVLSMGEDFPGGARMTVVAQELRVPDLSPPLVPPAIPTYYQTVCPQNWGCTGVYGYFGCPYTLVFNVTVDDSARGGSVIRECNYSTGGTPVVMSAYDGAFDSSTEIAVGSISVSSPVVVTVMCWDMPGNYNSTDRWVVGADKGGGSVVLFSVRGCGAGTTCSQNPPNCPVGCGECKGAPVPK